MTTLPGNLAWKLCSCERALWSLFKASLKNSSKTVRFITNEKFWMTVQLSQLESTVTKNCNIVSAVSSISKKSDYISKNTMNNSSQLKKLSSLWSSQECNLMSTWIWDHTLQQHMIILRKLSAFADCIMLRKILRCVIFWNLSN